MEQKESRLPCAKKRRGRRLNFKKVARRILTFLVLVAGIMFCVWQPTVKETETYSLLVTIIVLLAFIILSAGMVFAIFKIATSKKSICKKYAETKTRDTPSKVASKGKEQL